MIKTCVPPVTDTQSDRRRTAKRHLFTTSLAGSQHKGTDTLAEVTLSPLTASRSVHHPDVTDLARAPATLGPRSSAHSRGARCSVGLSSSAAGGRDASTAGSLTSSLMSDCRMRSAWGPRRLQAVGFRAYMTRHAAPLLGLARSADRSSREQSAQQKVSGDRWPTFRKRMVR